MESTEENIWKEDNKFLKRASLWIKAHPDRSVKFNKQLRPIRREIFDNLKLNISDGKWKYIDSYALNDLFWSYFERNKNIPVSDVFESIGVKLNDGDNNINLANYLKILNLIRSNVDLAIADIKNAKNMFLVNNEDAVYSQWENSLNIDNQMTKYNKFLHIWFSQYNMSFKSGLFEFKNIIYCYVLKNKFKNSDFFDFSESQSTIYVDWIAINLNILSKIIDIIGICESTLILKKI